MIFRAAYESLIERSATEWPDKSLWLRGGRVGAERDIQSRLELGMLQVEAYITHAANEGLTPILIDGEPAVEVEVTLNTGAFVVLGYIDVILQDAAGSLLIRDQKTGNEPKDPIQLQTYGYALEETYGLKAHWGDYYLAKQGSVSAPIDLSCIPKETLVRWFRAMDEQQRAGHYVPDFSREACFSCGVKRSCVFYS